MDFQNNDGFQRPTVKGNWSCSGCSKEITELPFEPSGDRPIYCKDCYRNNRPQRGDRGGRGFQRRMFQGNWKCSDCGTSITELPFEPSDDSSVYCVECFRKNKPKRDFR